MTWGSRFLPNLRANSNAPWWSIMFGDSNGTTQWFQGTVISHCWLVPGPFPNVVSTLPLLVTIHMLIGIYFLHVCFLFSLPMMSVLFLNIFCGSWLAPAGMSRTAVLVIEIAFFGCCKIGAGYFQTNPKYNNKIVCGLHAFICQSVWIIIQLHPLTATSCTA